MLIDGGILKEFGLVRRLQPQDAILPVVSTAGAAIEVADRMSGIEPDLRDDFDQNAVFHRQRSISTREDRFRCPADQPDAPKDRLWKPPSKANRRQVCVLGWRARCADRAELLLRRSCLD